MIIISLQTKFEVREVEGAYTEVITSCLVVSWLVCCKLFFWRELLQKLLFFKYWLETLNIWSEWSQACTCLFLWEPVVASVRLVHPRTWFKPPVANCFATDRSKAVTPVSFDCGNSCYAYFTFLWCQLLKFWRYWPKTEHICSPWRLLVYFLEETGI
jgi:hypothetical protein